MENNNSKNNIVRKSLEGILTLATVLTFSTSLTGCLDNSNNQEPQKTQQVQQQPKKQPDKNKRLRQIILNYMAQPKFSNSDLMEQITGTKAELEIFDMDESMLYFSIPTEDYREEDLKKLSPNDVEFGRTNDGEFMGGRLKLGDYIFNSPGNYFFRFPAKDFEVDPLDEINIKFRNSKYNLTMEELQRFAENSSIYGGSLRVETSRDAVSRTVNTFSNHGALVARKGETSLERLVSSIVSNNSSKEQTAQELLDFVTREIKYDGTDNILNSELLKRPNEVLMTKESDCSGKAILYASLLEQTDIDYMLIYTDDHISVAVEGDFKDQNRMSFTSNKKRYSIAETTARGFKIGRSRLNRALGAEEIKYIQIPGENSKIYNARTGQPLSFL
ncbi:hypothetical protein CL617_05390 [archaeon]|nr:hypothetical protein [archaeon]